MCDAKIRPLSYISLNISFSLVYYACLVIEIFSKMNGRDLILMAYIAVNLKIVVNVIPKEM